MFHGWIQRGAITDEMLIDVADYGHVVDGPGVMLIGHEAQYGLDQTKGRTGLLYSQRRARIEGGFEQALRYSVRQALRACALCKRKKALGGRLAFSGQEIMVRINDRLLAPNVAETWPAVEAAARSVLAPLLGARSRARARAAERRAVHVLRAQRRSRRHRRAARPVAQLGHCVLQRWRGSSRFAPCAAPDLPRRGCCLRVAVP